MHFEQLFRDGINSLSLAEQITSHAPIRAWFDSNSANKQKIAENVVFQHRHDTWQDENLVGTYHLNKALGAKGYESMHLNQCAMS